MAAELEVLLGLILQHGGVLADKEALQLACSLLCCSTEAAQAAHSLWEGKLAANLGTTGQQQQQGEGQQAARAASYCTWLAKHARLLRSVQLTVQGQEEEEALAAGIQAAAGVKDSPVAPAQRLQDAAAQYSLLAVGAAAVSPSPAALLPLSVVRVSAPVQGPLLRALSTSLAGPLCRLSLALDGSKKPNRALAAALGSLTGLQELALGTVTPRVDDECEDDDGISADDDDSMSAEDDDSMSAEDHGPCMSDAPPAKPGFVASVGPAFASLAGLTQLELLSHAMLGPKDVKLLAAAPALQRLVVLQRISKSGAGLADRSQYEELLLDHEANPRSWGPIYTDIAPLNLAPLTQLTFLFLAEMVPSDKLPPNLRHAQLVMPYAAAPVLKLASLRTLTLQDALLLGEKEWPRLLKLTQLSGLMNVRVELKNPFGPGYNGGEFIPWTTHMLSGEAPIICGIRQLSHLHLEGFQLQPTILSLLGSCHQLTYLALKHCSLVRDGEDWSCTDWTRPRLVACIARLAGDISSLAHLEVLHISLVLLHINSAAYDEMSDGGHDEDIQDDGDESPLSAADVQPLVDAAVSLRGSLCSVSISVKQDPTYDMGYQAREALSREQMAQLAAVVAQEGGGA